MVLKQVCWYVDPCSFEWDAGLLRCLVTAVLGKRGPLSRWAAAAVAGHYALLVSAERWGVLDPAMCGVQVVRAVMIAAAYGDTFVQFHVWQRRACPRDW